MQCSACLAPVDARGVFPGGSVKCPVCGALNAVPSGHGPGGSDPYRQAESPAPPPPKASSPSLGALCPRCTRALHDSTEGAGPSCPGCGGVFVAHSTLARMIDVARPRGHAMEHPRHAAHVPAESEVRYARCPQCAETMARVNFGKHSGIVVDVCRWHGTWFDAGELEAAMEFVHAGGVRRDDTSLG